MRQGGQWATRSRLVVRTSSRLPILRQFSPLHAVILHSVRCPHQLISQVTRDKCPILTPPHWCTCTCLFRAPTWARVVLVIGGPFIAFICCSPNRPRGVYSSPVTLVSSAYPQVLLSSLQFFTESRASVSAGAAICQHH